ncbi:MAG TPA: HAMP domain-containing sensor histidine kinase, partial [Terriglobales bacterium]|nr:HAMP domain-containing sensor histidine kinase [Terriglobales bacterium]
MDASQSIEVASHKRAWNLDRIFDAARKDTVIRLRWPLVILSSYLLYYNYNPTAALSESHVHAILGLYLLSHATLYFLADDLFDSPYFYGPLLLFDSLVLITALSISGTASDNFYLACIITIVLSTICRDGLGLLAVTFLTPLVYGYSVLNSSPVVPPEIYLQLPIPFVISLFYGYFAQVGRMRRSASEKDAEIQKEQKAAEALRRQRERLFALHEINVSAASTIDTTTIINAFLDKTLIHLPYAATIVRLKSDEPAVSGNVAARGLDEKNALRGEVLDALDTMMGGELPLTIRNIFSDPRTVSELELFKQEGLLSLIALPLSVNHQRLGYVIFLTRDEHDFAGEEVGFLSTLSGQVAIALLHAELFRRSKEQANELREAHKIKDAFLKNVSDKLNEPLTAIAGYADLFSQGLLGATTPIQEKAVENISRYSRDLHGVIDTVLQVSDLESETLRPALVETNPWEFFSELRSRYTPLEKDITIHWDIPSDASPFLCDRHKLRRILENLINNAIQFTDRGRITISARHSPARQELKVEVADTGRGIPAARLPKIFEKFGQLGNPGSAAKHGGVGLGLYLVKKYTDILGGRLNVESRFGEGSVFTLRIPALVQKAPSGQEQLLLLPD